MGWPEKITAEMDKDVNGLWFSSFSPLPLVYGKCEYIRADLVADRELEIIKDAEILYGAKIVKLEKEIINLKARELEIVRATLKAAADLQIINTTQSYSIMGINPETILKELGGV